jgi:hypothetical protein
MGLSWGGFGEPFLDLILTGFGDAVALAVGTGARLNLACGCLPISRESGEGRVDLPKRQGLAAPEVSVVVALQVVAVAGFSIDQPEEAHGNAHKGDNTMSVYSQSVALACVSPRVCTTSSFAPIEVFVGWCRRPSSASRAFLRVRLPFAGGDEALQASVDVEAPGARARLEALELRYETAVGEPQLGPVALRRDLEGHVSSDPFGGVLSEIEERLLAGPGRNR